MPLNLISRLQNTIFGGFTDLLQFCENCRKIFNNAKTSRGRGNKLRRFDGIAIALP